MRLRTRYTTRLIGDPPISLNGERPPEFNAAPRRLDCMNTTSDQAAPPRPPRVFSPGAAILAWLWPGLGHVSHGEKRRGILIMFGVLFLFFSGLLVGGLDAVDRREDHLWFLAQSLCGPIAFGADFANQSIVKQLPSDRRNEATGIAHPNEMGTLFIALAGLMNLVVILDALHFAPRPAPAPPRRRRAEDRA